MRGDEQLGQRLLVRRAAQLESLLAVEGPHTLPQLAQRAGVRLVTAHWALRLLVAEGRAMPDDSGRVRVYRHAGAA